MSDSASPKLSVGYKWREISNLPDDLDFLRDRELEASPPSLGEAKTNN